MGQFTWKSLDGAIGAATRAKLRVVVVLAYTPKWASPAEGHDLTDPAIYRHQPTHRRADWERFVSQVVSRYKGTVKEWQVWTTLSLPLYRGTTNEYLSLLQAAHGIVKVLDATSRLVLATSYRWPSEGRDRRGGLGGQKSAAPRVQYLYDSMTGIALLPGNGWMPRTGGSPTPFDSPMPISPPRGGGISRSMQRATGPKT